MVAASPAAAAVSLLAVGFTDGSLRLFEGGGGGGGSVIGALVAELSAPELGHTPGVPLTALSAVSRRARRAAIPPARRHERGWPGCGHFLVCRPAAEGMLTI